MKIEAECLTLEDRYFTTKVGGAFNARRIERASPPIPLQVELEKLYKTEHSGGDFDAKRIDTTRTK